MWLDLDVAVHPVKPQNRGKRLMDLFYTVRQHVLKELDGMVAAGELPSGLDMTSVAVGPLETLCTVIWPLTQLWFCPKAQKKNQEKLLKT